ncbi:hypothetical protein Maq22A_c13480 [Methylobacterium aquaticum]|uniref:Uncharacterized protein n=1 Tax=Methylobacterium aquaticum TaxID=270351 RepID=A0A0C6FSS4_9HYPH|nr:hypothetical protein Maq22A_c13480 [Methylobacterium aquaticum]
MGRLMRMGWYRSRGKGTVGRVTRGSGSHPGGRRMAYRDPGVTTRTGVLPWGTGAVMRMEGYRSRGKVGSVG